MGSGLIWAGLGKGIADAGTTFGTMGFKAAESELADQRALLKAQALERFKDQLAEERAQRDSDIYSKAQVRAGEIGTQRQTQQLETDSSKLASNAQAIAGDSPALSQDDMKRHLESLNPSERKALEGTGLISKAMSPMRQELQGYDDTIAAARELGGSSTLIKSLQDAKRERLNEIKAEFKEEGDKEERKLNRDREDRRDREARDRAIYQDRMAGAAETRAGAAVTAANRPPSGAADPNKPATTADIQRQITAATNTLATELGVAKNDVNSEVASLRKKAANGNAKAQATLDNIQPYLTELQDANRRMLDFKRARPSSNDKGGDNSNVNSGSRPPLSSFVR
jgi:hypothetical protein